MKRWLFTAVWSIGVCLGVHAADSSSTKLIRAGDDRIVGEYIVVLDDSVLPEQVPEKAQIIAAAHGATVKGSWSRVIKAFKAEMSEVAAERVSRHPLVKYVEENAPWYPTGSQQTFVNPVTCDPATKLSHGR